jgi:hypothetical protein
MSVLKRDLPQQFRVSTTAVIAGYSATEQLTLYFGLTAKSYLVYQLI